MAIVTKTGYVRDHSRAAFDALLEPVLSFRPNGAHKVAEYLMAGVEVEAEWVNLAAGSFTVDLENFPGLTYTPVLSWLVPDALGDSEKWSRGYEEWAPIYPGASGPISTSPPVVPRIEGIYYGYGAPPPELTNALYIDLAPTKPVLYGPVGGGL